MSGGSASGSWTAMPTPVPTRLLERARAYANGTPRRPISTVVIVELRIETHNAPHRPGTPNPLLFDRIKRMKKAAIGTVR